MSVALTVSRQVVGLATLEAGRKEEGGGERGEGGSCSLSSVQASWSVGVSLPAAGGALGADDLLRLQLLHLKHYGAVDTRTPPKEVV